MFRLLVLGTPPTTVTIAPGVDMPLLNMGVVRNHSVWLSLGGRDTGLALTYSEKTSKMSADRGCASRAWIRANSS